MTVPSILVPGASEFIGRHFLDAAKADRRIFALARRRQREAGVRPHPNIRWIIVDITDRERLAPCRFVFSSSVTVTDFQRSSEPLLRESIELGRSRFEPGHFGTGAALQALGECLVAEAEPLLLEIWEVLASILGEKHRGSKVTAKNLAEIYRRKGDARTAARWQALATDAP